VRSSGVADVQGVKLGGEGLEVRGTDLKPSTVGIHTSTPDAGTAPLAANHLNRRTIFGVKGASDSIVCDKAWIDEFEDDRSVIYLLDDNLRIAYCNKAWDEFAERNGGVKLQRTEQVGRRVLDSTAEPLKAFYRSAFERALAEHQPWEHLYECSSPGLYREFHMQVLPVQAPPCLVIVNSLVIEKPHERFIRPPLTTLYRTGGGVISMCMHCRRTRRIEEPEIWDWVPDFVASPPDGISHALCPTCFFYYYPPVKDSTRK
jgi:PAS fold